MTNKGQINTKDLKIQKLIEGYLRLKTSANELTVEGQHLNEDLLTAFVEGNLGRRETQPVINHLVNCTFCRHVTAELVKLEMAFADDEAEFVIEEKQPSKVSDVLTGLLSRIFGSNDEAVFAHQEKEEEPENQKSPEEDNENI